METERACGPGSTPGWRSEQVLKTKRKYQRKMETAINVFGIVASCAALCMVVLMAIA